MLVSGAAQVVLVYGCARAHVHVCTADTVCLCAYLSAESPGGALRAT